MIADNIHILNAGASASAGTISLPGAATQSFNLGPGAEAAFNWPQGTYGGPVKVEVASGPGVIASQRVLYNQSFSEVLASPAPSTNAPQFLNWYDNAGAGMMADNIHVVNPGGSTSTGVITLAGAPSQPFTLAPGQEGYYSWPRGTFGGPLKVQVDSGPGVIASERVLYYQSFGETLGLSPPASTGNQWFNWFDRASPGMNNDNIHVLNPGNSTSVGVVMLAGGSPQPFSLAPGQETYFTWPASLGGPVRIAISSGPGVIASQRVEFGQSFNETPALR